MAVARLAAIAALLPAALCGEPLLSHALAPAATRTNLLAQLRQREQQLQQQEAQARSLLFLQQQQLPLQAAAPAPFAGGTTGSSVLGLLQQRASTLPGVDDGAVKALRGLDLDHDGRVGVADIVAYAESQGMGAEAAQAEFAALDLNGDGAISAEELATVVPSAPTVLAAQPRSSEATLHAVASGAATGSVADVAQPVALDVESASKAGAAGGAAQSAAAAVVVQLEAEAKALREAQELQRHAAELRANASTLSRQMEQQALAAAAEAATKKAKELVDTMTEIETEAGKAEVKADMLRAKTKAEIREARDLMSVAGDALKGPGVVGK